MLTYCGPPGMGIVAVRPRLSNTSNPLASDTHSWFPLPPVPIFATANPYTGPAVLIVRFAAQLLGSNSVVLAAPFPAAYSTFAPGSKASNDGCPGTLTVQITC